MHILYLKDEPLWLESRTEQYIKFMKVENHDTTKLGNQQRKSFKKGNTKNVNKYQNLFNNVRTRVL